MKDDDYDDDESRCFKMNANVKMQTTENVMKFQILLHENEI